MTSWKALERIAQGCLVASLVVIGLVLDHSARSGSLAPLNRILSLTGWSPLTFAVLLPLWFLFWSSLWLMSHGRDRLRVVGEKFGLEFLPHGLAERRRLGGRAWARRVELLRDFLSGSLTPGDLVPVVNMGLPVGRVAGRRVLDRLLGRGAPSALELYAERGQGMSLLLAQLAVSLARRRAVVYASWSLLERGLEAAEFPDLLERPLALSIYKAPLFGWLRRPWVILDDCPPRGDHGEPEGSALLLQQFLRSLDSRGIRYVIGVRRWRIEPTVDEHTGWLGMDQQVPLSLDASDAEPIADRWIELSGPDRVIDAGKWTKRNRARFEHQLFAMLSLLWAELSSNPRGRYPELRSVLQPYSNLAPEDQLAVRWIALGQLLDAPVPEHLLKTSLGSSVADNAASSYEEFIRRDVDDRSGLAVYRLGGPIVACEPLIEELDSHDRFYGFCVEFARRSLGSAGPASANFWRFALNRMVSRWNPSLDRCEQRLVARRLYSGFRDGLEVSEDEDTITLVAWAATLRELGDRAEARRLYSTLWQRFEGRSGDGTTLLKTSLLIGVNDVLPEILSEDRCVDLAIELADSVGPGRPPSHALELANAFAEVARRNAADLPNDKRSLILARAESLAATSAVHPAYRPSANNLLALLAGGLVGAYRNEGGAERPDLQEAFRYVDQSFRSPPDVAMDDARKTWEDIEAHRVKALLSLSEHDRSGQFLDDAEEHLFHSFAALPRDDLPHRERQIARYCMGTSDFAQLQWKRRGDSQLAEEWYEESIRFLESLPEGERPDATREVYWNYAIYLRKESRGLLRMIGVLEKALDACATCSERKKILDSLSDTATGACHAALSRGRLRAVVRFGGRAIRAQEERLRLAESHQERATAAGDLASILFPRSVPSARRQELARLLAEDVSGSLRAAWREETENLAALKGLVAVVDAYPQYVPRSVIKSLERQLRKLARGDELWARRLVNALLSESLEKLEKGRPREFNDRLLSLLVPAPPRQKGK